MGRPRPPRAETVQSPRHLPHPSPRPARPDSGREPEHPPARGWDCLPTAAAPLSEGERSPALLLGAKIPAKTGPRRGHKSGSQPARELCAEVLPAAMGATPPVRMFSRRWGPGAHPAHHPPLLKAASSSQSHQSSLRVRVVQRDSLAAVLSEMWVTELQVKRPFLCWIPGGPHHWQTRPCSEGWRHILSQSPRPG